MSLDMLFYIIPIVIIAIGWFYAGKKKKEIIKTLREIQHLARLYLKAKEDGTITPDETKILLEQIVKIVEIWGLKDAGII